MSIVVTEQGAFGKPPPVEPPSDAQARQKVLPPLLPPPLLPDPHLMRRPLRRGSALIATIPFQQQYTRYGRPARARAPAPPAFAPGGAVPAAVLAPEAPSSGNVSSAVPASDSPPPNASSSMSPLIMAPTASRATHES